MAQKSWTLADQDRNLYEADFTLSAKEGGGQAVQMRRLQAGLSQGVDSIEIDNGKFRFVVLPTRGMGLWKGWLGETEIGWKSPVRGPVHPQYVPVMEPSGLGWLDGFDEWVCRCGLESNGAPDFDDRGHLRFPLHGKIANRPAQLVELTIDDESGELSLTGTVDETRFHFQKLRLTSTIKTNRNEPGVRIIDEVTNLSGKPAELQMLYHINYGVPLLDPGAKVVLPVKTLVPRDTTAGEAVENWASYGNEQADFSEQVYFLDLLAGDDGHTQVLLKDAHGMKGAGMRFSKKQLPCFTIWKNTPNIIDGYVTGLEPGTNFPNPRSFEQEQGRVVKLGPGQKAQFEIALTIYDSAEEISKAEDAITRLQGGVRPRILEAPQRGWSKLPEA